MSLPLSIHDRLRSAVQVALPCEAVPVRLAVGVLLSADHEPLHTLTACAFDPGEASLHVGAALDLVHIALQRLHARVDDPSHGLALLGKAGNVLAGDYLTSGSFKMLLRCSDMRVLKQVANAITRTCELECDALGQPPGPAAAAPLGEAAAWAGAMLAGHDDAVQALARRFGAALLSSRHDPAQLDVAVQAGQALLQASGNPQPLRLAQDRRATAAGSGSEPRPTPVP